MSATTTIDQSAPSGGNLVGTRLLRREDTTLASGESRFVDDLRVPGALHAAFVRSPHASALIKEVDLAATPAVLNAIVDAICHLGVKDLAMPATAERVWKAIKTIKEANA